ncbi:MAG: CHASE2 domain-containing protein [Silvanigrellaceae bacterium]
MAKKSSKKIRLQAWHIGLIVTLFFFIFNIQYFKVAINSHDGQQNGIFGVLERTVFDYRIKSRGARKTSEKVGLLAIDEKSIAKFGRWPFSRSAYVDAFKNLKKAGVQWIGMDVLFLESEQLTLNDALDPMQEILQKSLSPQGVLDPRTFVAGIAGLVKDSPNDKLLGNSIAEFQNVVQAFMFVSAEQVEGVERDWKSANQMLLNSSVELVKQSQGAEGRLVASDYPLVNIPAIAGEKPILGFINNDADNDGLARRYQLIREIPAENAMDESKPKRFAVSLALQLASRYLNKKIAVEYGNFINAVSLVDDAGNLTRLPLSGQDGHMLINHYGRSIDSENRITPTIISLADAAENNLEKNVPPVLILGSTATGAHDVRPSPLDSQASGVEHHFAILENILRNDFLNRPTYFIINELGLALIAGLLLVFLLQRASALLSLVILVASHIALEMIDRNFLFGRNDVYNFALIHIQNASIFLSIILYKYFIEEREKRELTGAFQRYLNPSVIKQVLASPEGLKLGGDKRELTVFFSDVRGFTTISEVLSPEALASLLNEYFTPMTNIVLDSGGLLDKYIGDALMAVWGAPLPMDDHADKALESALKMLDALDVLREGWKPRSLPAIDIGCGINTGPMVVGNMGSDLRFDYTVLGDSVNLGSRLEGITKEYGVRIVCSGQTKKSLKNPEKFILRELDWIKVKGKNEPVTIHEVMRFAPEKKAETEKVRVLFQDGLEKYRNRDFRSAQTLFMQVLQMSPQDGPSSIFLERCEYFLEHPVDAGWDGIWVMKSK